MTPGGQRSSYRHPPRLAQKILRWMLPAGIVGESIKGDLDQEYEELARTEARPRLRWWYCREAVTLTLGFWIRKVVRRDASRDGVDSRRRGAAWSGLASDFGQDVRVAMRWLRRRPAFSAAAILTIAVGIGANTAMFSIVNGILWKSLPYRDSDRLVNVWVWPGPWFSKAAFVLFQEQATSYDRLAAMSYDRFTTRLGDESTVLTTPSLSADFFQVLDAGAALGRVFAPGEDRRGSDDVVVLTNAYWQLRFGGQPDVLGRTLEVAGTRRTVIGVLSPRFGVAWAPDADLVVPMRLDNDTPDYRYRRLRVIGRLKPGVTPAQATDEFHTILADWRSRFSLPEDFGQGAVVRPLREELARDVRPTLLLLLGAVALALLIATVNVANLFLARALSRHQEISVRVALGASTGRLVRQLLTEATVVGVIGGAMGLGLAAVALESVVARFPPFTPRLGELQLDGWAVGVSVALALITGWSVGLATAAHVRRSPMAPAITGSRGSTGSAGQSRLRTGLVVAEVAIAVLLVTGSALLIGSFNRMLRADPGFRAEGLLVFDVTPDADTFESPALMRDFYREVETRVAALPQVTAAGLSHVLPIRGDWATIYTVEGQPIPAGQGPPVVQYRVVTPGYFAASGIPIIRGRAFNDADVEGTEPVVIVNERLAREGWKGEDPLGRRIDTEGGVNTVVGVVADVKAFGLQHDAPPIVYRPHAQANHELHRSGFVRVGFLVRTDHPDPTALAGPIRDAARAIDPRVPVDNFELMTDVVSNRLGQPRLLTTTVALFALAALVLGAMGIHGVMSHVIGERNREMGIRVALGASAARVVRQVLADAARMTGLGIAIGLLLAAGLTRFLGSVLYEVSPLNPVAFLAAPLLLFAVALAAAFVPARRAGRVDPIEVLRAE